jgi:septum formation protein
MQLVLASSSAYRKTLLDRLRLPFTCASPAIDETPLPGETSSALAMRLAEAKARALAMQFPDALIIGCDQVCCCQGHLLGKPGSFDAALAQLQLCNGRQAEFLTALSLLDTRSGNCQHSLDSFNVQFRQLSHQEMRNYLQLEQPFDCAGSFKAEGLGITLFEAMDGRDFHSLLGLPLISLCTLLRKSGLNPLLPDAAGPA